MQNVIFIILLLFPLSSLVMAQTPMEEGSVPPIEEDKLVSDELLERFNRLARRARNAEYEGPAAVIKIYAEAILDPEYEAYGQIHLKLGQLLKKQGRRVDAAYHFRKCFQDHRVEELDRNIICKTGYEDTTTTLEIVDAPPRSRVVILEPSLFSGPFESGGRLPLGRIRLVVEVPGYYPHESTVNLDGPTRWVTELGMKRPKGPLVPDSFLGDSQKKESSEALAEETIAPPPAQAKGPSTIPYWIVGGVGAAVGTVGIIMGADAVNKSKQANQDRDALRQRAIVGDIMGWSGFSVAAGAAAWYLLTPSE